VLTAAAAGLTAACTSKPSAVPRVATRDERLSAEAAIREEALIGLYAAALAAFPALAAELQPLADQHQQHRAALGAEPLPTPLATSDPALLGRTPAEARKNLAALEQGTAKGHADSALTAGRALAQVLASLSACEAAHAEVLR
jgi:hypothetical protein